MHCFGFEPTDEGKFRLIHFISLLFTVVSRVWIRAKRPIRLAFISGFSYKVRPEVFLNPMDGMLVHGRITPSVKFAGTNLYTWVERGAVRVKCHTQLNTTQCPLPGFEPGPLETSTLTTWPPHHSKHKKYKIWWKLSLLIVELNTIPYLF